MSQDVWVVLYTHQKTNKQKKYKDGLLKYNPSNQKATLCDESGKTIESKFIRDMTIEAGAELEFDGNLIQVEELKSSGSGEGPASQAAKPIQQTQQTKPTTTKTVSQPTLRRPALRPKLAKRPIKPVEEEDEGDGNEEEEEEVVHVHKAAKPTINQKPTPISSVDSDEYVDELNEYESPSESQHSASVASDSSSARDSDTIMAMLFGDDDSPAPSKPPPKAPSNPPVKSNTTTKLTPQFTKPTVKPQVPIPDTESDGEEPPPSFSSASKLSSSKLPSSSHPTPTSNPAPKRRRVGLQKKTVSKEVEEEEESLPGEMKYNGGDEDDDDVQLSSLFGKNNTPAPSKPSASSSSSIASKSSPAKPKLASKGFKVPVSKVEQKKAVLFQHDRITFPDPELCEGLIKQGSAPARQVAIPNLFDDLTHYISTFTRAITEDINLQLVELSQKVYQNFAELHRKTDKTGTVDGPRCPHGPALLLETKKEGKNKGKEFYSCATRNKTCKFFLWADKVDPKKKSSLKQKVANYTLDVAHQPAFHKAGVHMYIDCELIAKRDEPVDFFAKRNGKEEPEKKSDKPPILYLKLPEKKETSAAFSKDDLWLISTDPKFSGDGLFFFAKSVFHSPGRSGLLEVKPIEDYPKLPGTSTVYALHAVNVATELSMIDCLSNLSFTSLPILPHLIWGKDPDKSKNYQIVNSLLSLPESSSSSSSSKNTSISQDPFELNISEEEADRIAYEVIETYKLNIDQERVLRSCMEWFKFAYNKSEDGDSNVNNLDDEIIWNIHLVKVKMMGMQTSCVGFWGETKRKRVKVPTRTWGWKLIQGVTEVQLYLLLLFVFFIIYYIDNDRILNEAKNEQIRILVSAVTNVAVDRILLGLVAQEFTQFIRVGSLKKIAKPILPYTLHESRKNAKSDFDEDREALKDLNDMMHHDNLSKEDTKYVLEMIAAIKQGANKNKKKELKSMRVVGVTCVASAFSILEGNCFPIVFLDECSQMLEPLSLLPISRFGCSKLLAVGDPMQLPPTLRNGSSNENTKKGESGLEKTLFLRLVFLGFTPIMLRTQYRCHPMLSGIVNTLFYNNRLIDGVKAAEREPLIPSMPVLMLCDSEKGKEKADKGGSYMNEWEAEVVVKLVVKLLNRGIDASQIGVICIYKAQLKQVQDLLRATLGKNKPKAKTTPNSENGKSNFQIQDSEFDPDDFFDDSWMEKRNEKNVDEDKENESMEDEKDEKAGDNDKPLTSDIGKLSEGGEKEKESENEEASDVHDEVQVSTVDAFQGAEKEVIILTCSRTDRLGFSDSPHRLNVAITRAKRHLVIVGQQKLMSTSDIWKHVIAQAKKSPYGIQKSETIVYNKDFAFEKNK